jgi:hypothetical protein
MGLLGVDTSGVRPELLLNQLYPLEVSSDGIDSWMQHDGSPSRPYILYEGVSGLELFQLSASDPDTDPTSLTYRISGYRRANGDLYDYPTTLDNNRDVPYAADNFTISESNKLVLTAPIMYDDLGGASNLYRIRVEVNDNAGGSYTSGSIKPLYFKIHQAAQATQGGSDDVLLSDTSEGVFIGTREGDKILIGGDGVDTVNYELESDSVSFALASSSSSPTYSSKSGGSSSSTSINSDLTISKTYVTSKIYDSKYGRHLGTSESTESETLSNIERLYFTDKAYALDLDGNAGIAAKAIIATFGASDLSTYMKAALSIVDNGTTLDELCDLVISGGYIESSAGGTDMSSFVEYVYGNVVGRELNAFDQIIMTGASTGGFTKAELLKLAVRLDDVASQITTNAIDLIGVPGSSDGEQLVISFDV